MPLGFWAYLNFPYLDAMALEATLDYLLPSDKYPHRRVLDVGSGSGYTTNLLAQTVGRNGLVVGIDHFHQLRDIGERNMRKSGHGKELIDSGTVAFVTGDGRDGLTTEQRRGIARIDDNTKWDVIHVGACARWVVPEALMQQLKAPGWSVEVHPNLPCAHMVICSSLTIHSMFVPIMQIKSSRLVHVVWKIEKDELGDVRRTVVCDDAPCAWLQHLPDDTEEERNQPGYGLLVKTSTPQDEDG